MRGKKYWDHIPKPHELQAQECLHAEKLYEVQWGQLKMKVKLAAQTLSSSVADALAFCQNDLGLPEFRKCTATVEFIRIIDKLFHLFNSRYPLAKGFKSPLSVQNESNWRPLLLFAA